MEYILLTQAFSRKEVVKEFVTMDLNHENIPPPLKPKKMKLPQELEKMLTFEYLSSSARIYKTPA